MNPFPDNHDLITLFECEPELADKNIPWSYNHLSFRSVRGDDQIVCVIEPGYETLRFDWHKKNEQIISLNLNWVNGIETEFENTTEALHVTFRDQHLLPLRIQLKPKISISWGTKSEPI